MDSLYMFVAAAAKDSTNAQILLAPFLTLAMLFNGSWALFSKGVQPWNLFKEAIPTQKKGLKAWVLKLHALRLHGLTEVLAFVDGMGTLPVARGKRP